jgi:hypothetical protein
MKLTRGLSVFGGSNVLAGFIYSSRCIYGFVKCVDLTLLGVSSGCLFWVSPIMKVNPMYSPAKLIKKEEAASR